MGAPWKLDFQEFLTPKLVLHSAFHSSTISYQLLVPVGSTPRNSLYLPLLSVVKALICPVTSLFWWIKEELIFSLFHLSSSFLISIGVTASKFFLYKEETRNLHNIVFNYLSACLNVKPLRAGTIVLLSGFLVTWIVLGTSVLDILICSSSHTLLLGQLIYSSSFIHHTDNSKSFLSS